MRGRRLVKWALLLLALALAQAPGNRQVVSAQEIFRALALATPAPEGVLLLRDPNGLPLDALRSLERTGKVGVFFGTCPKERVGYRLGGRFATHTFAFLAHGGFLIILSGERPERLEMVQVPNGGNTAYRTLSAQLGLDRLLAARDSLPRCP